MNKVFALAALTLALAPTASLGAVKQKTASRPAVYVCQKCHMRFSAAKARQDHYKDPMDGGALLRVKPAAGKQGPSMGGMKM